MTPKRTTFTDAIIRNEIVAALADAVLIPTLHPEATPKLPPARFRIAANLSSLSQSRRIPV